MGFVEGFEPSRGFSLFPRLYVNFLRFLLSADEHITGSFSLAILQVFYRIRDSVEKQMIHSLIIRH